MAVGDPPPFPFDSIRDMLQSAAKIPPNPFPTPPGLGTPPPPDVRRRAVCLLLAGMLVPQDATVYDRIIAANYLDVGYTEPTDDPILDEDEDDPRCSVADLGDRIPGRDG